MLLPNNTTFLLNFLQVSIICFSLYTFDANVAIIILLPLFVANISFKFSSTIDSLNDVPSTRAFVESLINNLTLLLPILAIL